MKDPEKSGWRSSANDMSQTISLFKKYLLTRSPQNNVGKTNTEESEIIKNCPSDAPSVSAPQSNPRLNRPPSLLDKRLLPQMRCDGAVPLFASEERSSTAQLTIFYGGSINVYDNVPIDKAQAIMLLAGESSSSNTTESPKIDTEEAPTHQSYVIPKRKPKTGLPIARRHSLQCFLQKRHERKVNKSPYASASPSSRNMTEVTMNEDPYQNHGLSLSPFPSRLGFCVPVSVDKAC